MQMNKSYFILSFAFAAICATVIFGLMNPMIKNSTIQNQETFVNGQKKNSYQALNIRTNNLMKGNQTGSAISSDMVSYFAQVINEAYANYQMDLKQNTQYIQEKLGKAYGWSYNVLIIFNDEHNINWSLQILPGHYIWWQQVNRQKPNWYYFIFANDKYADQTVDFINGLGKGSGIDSEKQTAIRNIIKNQQAKDMSEQCNGPAKQQIPALLSAYDGQIWSTVYKGYSALNFNSRLQSINHQYIQLYISGSKCEYILWVNKK